ncbi:MAG: IS1182 family transposase, partial [bacterium]|nr:IS1182 family transposase [bacterium]
MMPRFKQMPMAPSQVMLFSQSVDDALPVNNDVRCFSDVMGLLDYSIIESKCCDRGCPPYPPSMMANILGYAYSKGVRSSRKIEEMLKVDVRFIWLSGGLKPDHNTIARFRKENWRELESIFKDSVRVCAEAGLVFLNAVATDGTKIEAAASKRRVYSQSKLDRQLAAIEKILAEAEEVDATEDEMYGGGIGNELPEHLRDAKARKEKLEEIAQRLEESKKTAVVETDADARVMMTTQGKRPAYNLQASVDAENQVIVAMALTQSENDIGLLPEMVEEIESNTGLAPDISLVDSGYGNEDTLKWLDDKHDALMPLQEQPQESARNDLFASRCFLADNERDVLICPAGRELPFKGIYKMGSGHYRQYAAVGCQSCSFYRECATKGRGSRRVNVSVVATQRKAMRERLNSPNGKKLYDLRRETVEPVFGQMKRNQGFERFICWGKEGAHAESALMCIAHNVAKCVANIAAR